MTAAAVNDAATKAQELAADKMSVITGGMNIPGLAWRRIGLERAGMPGVYPGDSLRTP